MTLLPGRFVPSSGTLHRYPAKEECNLDDTSAETHVETLDDLLALPDDSRFCANCYSGTDIVALADRFDSVEGDTKP